MPSIVLQDVRHNSDAIKVLWDLLEERPPEANISHGGYLPEWTDHQAHVQYHDHLGWYLIMADGVAVGAVYITKKGEIGIAILKAQQRKGYAKAGIKAVMEKHPRHEYLANVAPANQRSHALFTQMGGTIVQSTYRIKK
jgi:RimJ/RimL family protein N-acetyltransferase